MLKIESYHRSEKEARKYVSDIASGLGIQNFKTKLLCNKSFEISTSDKPLNINAREEIHSCRKTGVPKRLQILFDQSVDRLMPAPFDIGVAGSVKGLAIDISMQIGSYSASVAYPGLLEAPVTALADDIIYFRSQVVEESKNNDLKQMARSYRTYLQVSISFIDAFMGFMAFALKEQKPSILQDANYNKLISRVPFEQRLESWFKIFDGDFQKFCQTKSWNDLKKIRKKRNEYIHSSVPIFTADLGSIVNELNCCRQGVGATVLELRKIAGLETKLSYIQKIITAPKISKFK